MSVVLKDEHCPTWVSEGRVPCLNGLRAVSIGLVILSHLALQVPVLLSRIWKFIAYGCLGVDVFFVISGFLITLLMVREQERTGRISLRNFYSRRALRIMPAYLTYLAFVSLLTFFHLESLSLVDWITAFTYTTNLRLDWTSPHVVAHTWSLSLEEHFYLLWPLILVMGGKRRSVFILATIFLANPLVRYAGLNFARHIIDINVATPTRISPIIAGCLLAYLVTDSRLWPFLSRLRTWTTGICITSSLLLIASVEVSSRYPDYVTLFKENFDSTVICLGILALVNNPRCWIGCLLESRPMAAIGVLSYSLYLWQQPFSHSSQIWMFQLPQSLLFMMIAAVCSYFLIERPFLRIKDRWKQIQ